MKSSIYFFLLIPLLFGMTLSCSENKKESSDNKNVSITEEVAYPETIEFPSLDGLMITANLYEKDPNSPVIVLCHQARFNKYEYAGTAEKLNDLGFTCIAIDQRSGGPIVTHQNETTLRARKQGKPVDYLDAEQDIQAAVNFAAKKYGRNVILWGSSYSSTLALYVAIENENVDAVVSFSPGNYFAPEKGSLTEMLPSFEKPMFITSSKMEAEETSKLVANMNLGENQTLFIPESDGFHGSRALWENQPGGEEYWDAITGFLSRLEK